MPRQVWRKPLQLWVNPEAELGRSMGDWRRTDPILSKPFITPNWVFSFFWALMEVFAFITGASYFPVLPVGWSAGHTPEPKQPEGLLSVRSGNWQWRRWQNCLKGQRTSMWGRRPQKAAAGEEERGRKLKINFLSFVSLFSLQPLIAAFLDTVHVD